MKRLLIIVGLTTCLFSCASDSEEELAEMQQEVDNGNNGGNGGSGSTTDVSLSTDVIPIIDGNCAVSGCHVTGRTSPDLSSSSGIIANAIRVKAEVVSGRMPRGGSLTNEEINLISDWVDQGAKDN